jgi:cyclase
MQELVSRELLFNSIDRDGLHKGCDLAMIEKIAKAIDILLVALGGAATLDDFRKAVDQGASAVAVGSMFVFHGKHKAVLITYSEYRKSESLSA